MLPEMTILMLTLFAEGSICSMAELRAIARTIQVRAEDRGTSIHEECLRPHQYSCWNGFAGKHKILKAYRSGTVHGSPAWRRCKQVAEELYAGTLNGMPRWSHYYNPVLCKPKWASELIEKREMKYHVFGRIEK